MGRLIPEDIEIDGDVNVNLNINMDSEKIGKSIESIIWTFCFASIIRSRFRK